MIQARRLLKKFLFEDLLGGDFEEIWMMERERDRRVELTDPPITPPTFF
jgi:hypothetical protein